MILYTGDVHCGIDENSDTRGSGRERTRRRADPRRAGMGRPGGSRRGRRVLQVPGMSYEIHSCIPSSCVPDENGMFLRVEGGRRVKNVLVGGEPIDPERTCTLACHD